MGISAGISQWNVCCGQGPCHSQMVMHRVVAAWDLSIRPQHVYMGKPFFWNGKEEDEKVNALPQACRSPPPDLKVEISSSRPALWPPHA